MVFQELQTSEIKNLINQKLMVLIRKGLDKELVRLQLKGLAKLARSFRDEGQRQFEKSLQKWNPQEKELSLLLKELSRIDKTEPIIIDTTDSEVMLDLFGHHPYLFDMDGLRTMFRTHWRQYFELVKKAQNRPDERLLNLKFVPPLKIRMRE